MGRRRPLTYSLIPVIVFIALEILSFVMIRYDSIIQSYRIMEYLRSVQIYFWEKGEKIQNYFRLDDINRDLANENARLNTELEFYRNIIGTATMDMPEWYGGYFLPAKVQYNSLSHKDNYMILDKGSNDGVRTGMGVITPNGIAGHIVQVTDRYSKVASFISQESGIGAVIAKNNTFGTLRWGGKETDIARLDDIPAHADVAVGDTIKTSGYSFIYPAGLPLGTVKALKIVNGVDYLIKVRLFEDYRKLDYVYIVKLDRTDNMKELIGENSEDYER